MTVDPFVPASWLKESWLEANAPVDTASEPDIVVCDVRHYLDGRSGWDAYTEGHIPGARYIDMGSVLADPPGPIVGRHPLADPAKFAAGLSEAGISDNSTVIAYDDQNGMVAGRLVWMLRILGQDAAVLEGGLTSWSGPLEAGEVSTEPALRTVHPWPVDATVDADEVAAAVTAGVVVADSRAPERYRGETEPIDPKAGHIPGAINLAFAENFDADGKLRPDPELSQRFNDAGVDETAIFYCGSGVSACVNVLTAEHLGIGRPKLYVGSWSGWSSDPGRPVAP